MKLYKFNINDFTDEIYNSSYNDLPDDKKMAVDRCKVEKIKKLRVAGDMLLKKALNENGVTDIEFYKNSKGKPYLKNSHYYFNISHSGDMCICALSDKEIGVDIEKIESVNLKTTRKFATENEIEYIFGKVPDENDFSSGFNESSDIYERFFEIWTLKEAYFKMLGTGIATDLKSVEFSIKGADVFCSRKAKMSIDKSTDGYIISVSE